jgi:hypothetical protein
MSIAAELHEAADIIERRGHQAPGWGSPEGPVCVASALAEVAGVATWGFGIQPLTEAGRVLARHLGFGHKVDGMYLVSGLCEFNNTHTTDEVLAGLRGAAEREEALV